MRKTAFGGRRLGEAFETLAAMIDDPDCKVVLTLSGAMTIAKMGKIISTMIERGMVHVVISTGALVAHGLSESIGKLHYRHPESASDEELFRKGYNRVYDTLEMESNLNYVEHVVSLTLKRLNTDQPLASHILTRELGKTLAEEFEGDGILKSAYLKNVPVYIPAFTDSEMGLDVGTWAMGKISTASAVRSKRAATWPCYVGCTNVTRTLIPILISTIMPMKCWAPSGSVSSRSEGECLVIGRNRWPPISKSETRAWAWM